MNGKKKEKQIKAFSLVCLNTAVAMVAFKLADYHPQDSGSFKGCVIVGLLFVLGALAAGIILYLELFFYDV